MNLSDFDLNLIKEDKKLLALYRDVLELNLEIIKKNEKMRLSDLKNVEKSIAIDDKDDIVQTEF